MSWRCVLDVGTVELILESEIFLSGLGLDQFATHETDLFLEEGHLVAVLSWTIEVRVVGFGLEGEGLAGGREGIDFKMLLF